MKKIHEPKELKVLLDHLFVRRNLFPLMVTLNHSPNQSLPLFYLIDSLLLLFYNFLFVIFTYLVYNSMRTSFDQSNNNFNVVGYKGSLKPLLCTYCWSHLLALPSVKHLGAPCPIFQKARTFLTTVLVLGSQMALSHLYTTLS